MSRLPIHLLVPLDVFIKEKHVSKAAQKLNISQSSASKLLNQLRHAFKDPLLVRSARGMEATEFALNLHTKLSPLIREIENLVSVPETFDAKTYNKIIRVGIPSSISDVILPKIANALKISAPGIRLDVVNVDTKTLPLQLINNEVDMIVTYAKTIPPTCKATLLYTDHPVCMARKNHILMQQKTIKIQDYLQHEHIVLIYDEISTTLWGDSLLKKQGLQKRDIRLTIRSPLSGLSMIEESDRLLTTTKTFAEHYAAKFGLDYRQFAMKVPTIPIHLIWTPVHDTSPWHLWIRNLIKNSLNTKPYSPRR